MSILTEKWSDFEEEFNARQARFERQIADPNFLMMLILLAACGTKPI